MYKLVYQGEFGVGHIIASREAAAQYLNEEISSMPRFTGEPIFEPCSPDGSMIRVNLRPFVEREYSVEKLVDAMMETASQVKGDPMRFDATWRLIRGLVEQRLLDIPLSEFDKFTREIRAKNFPYIHHSRLYEERYKPAYRVVLLSAFERYCPDTRQ